jgi:hypothetical protein
VIVHFIDVIIYGLVCIALMSAMILTTDGVAELGNFAVVDVRKDTSIARSRD